MPNPWVSLKSNQLIPVNKAVNKKDQLEKGCLRWRKKFISVTFAVPIKSSLYVDNILGGIHQEFYILLNVGRYSFLMYIGILAPKVT
jgi:hypothetical protein